MTSKIDAGHIGLLYIDGAFVRSLPDGVHAVWHFDQEFEVEPVDFRVRTVGVQGQVILTCDMVALVINITVTFQIGDAAMAAQILKDPLDQWYEEIQFGPPEAVGTRSLHALLEDRTVIFTRCRMMHESNRSEGGIQHRRSSRTDRRG